MARKTKKQIEQEQAEAAEAALIAQAEAEQAEIDGEEELAEEEEAGKPTMSETLRKYRVGYQKAVSYSKGATLDNGDQLAQALRGCTPDQACAVADQALGEEPGYHAERYASLNVGQRRMNSGNRVRAAIKKGTIDTESVLDIIKAVKGE